MVTSKEIRPRFIDGERIRRIALDQQSVALPDARCSSRVASLSYPSAISTQTARSGMTLRAV